jgi:hypothetical protein
VHFVSLSHSAQLVAQDEHSPVVFKYLPEEHLVQPVASVVEHSAQLESHLTQAVDVLE